MKMTNLLRSTVALGLIIALGVASVVAQKAVRPLSGAARKNMINRQYTGIAQDRYQNIRTRAATTGGDAQTTNDGSTTTSGTTSSAVDQRLDDIEKRLEALENASAAKQ